LARRLFRRQAVEVAEHHGRPAAPRQAIDFVVKDVTQVIMILLVSSRAG
jgi:hypothetical protein